MRVPTLAVVLVLLTSACGGDGTTAAASPTTAPPPESPTADEVCTEDVLSGELHLWDAFEQGCFACEGGGCAWFLAIDDPPRVRVPFPCIQDFGASENCTPRYPVFNFCEQYGPAGMYPKDRHERDLIGDIYDEHCSPDPAPEREPLPDLCFDDGVARGEKRGAGCYRPLQAGETICLCDFPDECWEH